MLVCFVLGNGCLFSWNSMLTIEDYYVYLFPKNHPTRVLTPVYQSFALRVTALLTYHEAKINTRLRILTGYTLFFLSSFAIIILDVATKGQGGVGEFVGVCVISAAFGIGDAHVQGGMVGDLSLMCPEFIQSYLAGLAASGAITSALRLITNAAFESSRDGLRKGAMLFFSISCFFELLCVLLYTSVFPTLPIVKYYRSKAASEGSKTVAGDLAAAGVPTGEDEIVEEEPERYERLSSKQLLLQNMDYALYIFLTYVLTLSIFPGFLSEDTGSHSLGPWYALVLIAMYNVWDLIGRYVPFIVKMTSRKCITAAALASFILVLFHCKVWRSRIYDRFDVLPGVEQRVSNRLCPYGGAQGIKGKFTSAIPLAVSCFQGPEQNALGNVLVVFLLIGLFSGVVHDWLWLR
ncbi:equilibrative nucleotide transporter 3-like [Panicum miliaceum]|uniref:Equilibrative nucleotide transporter 3-like n=1 Tax=Panicum miliaceum TaxID=4540 RepID=A0A3L6QR21_PANMI|nr:equilibrative nucleotide transporter 3-like [Panicum miliaceum]